MPRSPLKAAVKRGALIAAANWQVTVIQASTDSMFKMLLAWLLRGLVFQYVGLTSVGAHLRLHKTFEHEHFGVRPRSSRVYDQLPSRA